jgi:UDP-GlcNAc:undecaprenyl-phosphate GlcNAc-1-phosphate transferase
MGVPIFDTLFSMVRRYLERRPMFSADRGHIHHRLLDMGFTHRRAVLTIYAASAVFSVAAIAASLGKAWQVGVALIVSSAVLFALVRAAGYIEYLQGYLRRRGRFDPPRTIAVRRALPAFAENVSMAADASELRRALDDLATAVAFDRIALLERGVAESESPRQGGRRDPENLETTLPVGPDGEASADLQFVWPAGDGAITPAMEVLLELIADLVERALVRVDSPLAPKTAPAPRAALIAPPSARPSQVSISASRP